MNPEFSESRGPRLRVSREAIRAAIADLERSRSELIQLVDDEIRKEVQEQLRAQESASDPESHRTNQAIIGEVRESVLREPLTRINERIAVLVDLLAETASASQAASASKGEPILRPSGVVPRGAREPLNERSTSRTTR